MGIDPVYFGVLMILSLMVGIITPPFGICLFVVSGVAKLPVKAVTKEAVRYIPGSCGYCPDHVFPFRSWKYCPTCYLNSESERNPDENIMCH